MSFRGFIAIDIKPSDEIRKFVEELHQTKAKLKLVELENMHITLKFLGETEESKIDEIVDIIKKSIENIRPFKITLEKTGVFPKPSYIKIIWIGINDNGNLIRIAEYLDKHLVNLGYRRENKAFNPHLTVARVKNPGDKDVLLQVIEKYNNTIFSEIAVENIYLKKSKLTPTGPIYSIIREIKLEG